MRFPHHHVHQAFTVKAGHGPSDDKITGVLAPGDLGLITACLAAEFIKPAHGPTLLERVFVMLSGLGKGFLTLEVFPT
jgi:hypothetical protein